MSGTRGRRAGSASPSRRAAAAAAPASVSSPSPSRRSSSRAVVRGGASSAAPPQFSVLLPVYNERENLPLVVAMLDRVFSDNALSYEVVIVEDSSPDGTYAVAQRLRDTFGGDKIKILHRPGKQGLGTAYIDGLRLASGAFVFIMDADMSHHVSAPSLPPRPARRQPAAASAPPQSSLPTRRLLSVLLPRRSPSPSPPSSPSSATATMTW
jgi:hypothetical protein